MTIPFPKICTSHSSIVLNPPGNLIFSEIPIAFGSHRNNFESSSDMILLSDPHFLYVPLCGPMVIEKPRRK